MKQTIVFMETESDTFPPLAHDHRECVRRALEVAEEHCRRRGARLTATRRRVLELVWSSHEPVGAYALLEMMGNGGRIPAPPTVYRALDFLIAEGLVHRLESRNAFVGCRQPGSTHFAQFLICSVCGRVAELSDPAIGQVVEAKARKLGFIVRRQTVEVEGICLDCQSKGLGSS